MCNYIINNVIGKFTDLCIFYNICNSSLKDRDYTTVSSWVSWANFLIG